MYVPSSTDYKLCMRGFDLWNVCCTLLIDYQSKSGSEKCRSDDNKDVLDDRKKYIQREIHKHFGLIVDTPKQGASSSNNGNTARRFFEHYERISEITSFNQELLKNLYVILQTMACGKAIHVERFRLFARATAELFIKNYSWFNMPASVHKVLIHGANIINSFVIPIGQLSEEAQEARNKDLKRCCLKRIICALSILRVAALSWRSGAAARAAKHLRVK